MRRILLALLLLVVSTRPVRADSFALGNGATLAASMAAGVGLSLLLLPLALAVSLPHSGYEDYPYDETEGYGAGAREIAFEGRYEAQLLAHKRTAHHGLLRVRGSGGLGWDVNASSYAKEALNSNRRAGYYNANLTANFLQNGASLLEFGFGLSAIQATRNRIGASAELGYEWFPKQPFNLYSRYQAGLLGGQLYHDLSGGLGASWNRVGLDAGYRAFLNPLKNAYGPEASLRVWF